MAYQIFSLLYVFQRLSLYSLYIQELKQDKNEKKIWIKYDIIQTPSHLINV